MEKKSKRWNFERWNIDTCHKKMHITFEEMYLLSYLDDFYNTTSTKLHEKTIDGDRCIWAFYKYIIEDSQIFDVDPDSEIKYVKPESQLYPKNIKNIKLTTKKENLVKMLNKFELMGILKNHLTNSRNGQIGSYTYLWINLPMIEIMKKKPDKITSTDYEKLASFFCHSTETVQGGVLKQYTRVSQNSTGVCTETVQGGCTETVHTKDTYTNDTYTKDSFTRDTYTKDTDTTTLAQECSRIEERSLRSLLEDKDSTGANIIFNNMCHFLKDEEYSVLDKTTIKSLCEYMEKQQYLETVISKAIDECKKHLTMEKKQGKPGIITSPVYIMNSLDKAFKEETANNEIEEVRNSLATLNDNVLVDTFSFYNQYINFKKANKDLLMYKNIKYITDKYPLEYIYTAMREIEEDVSHGLHEDISISYFNDRIERIRQKNITFADVDYEIYKDGTYKINEVRCTSCNHITYKPYSTCPECGKSLNYNEITTTLKENFGKEFQTIPVNGFN